MKGGKGVDENHRKTIREGTKEIQQFYTGQKTTNYMQEIIPENQPTCTRGISLVRVIIARRLISIEASTLNNRMSAGIIKCICSSRVPTRTSFTSEPFDQAENHKKRKY